MMRREVLRMFTAAAAATLLRERASAQGAKLKVLILGGTGFIGPHFVAALQAAGHKLTLFNRGRSNPGLFAQIETLIGDRDGKLEALKGREWDVVIDDSGYVPRHVRLTAELLEGRIRHYIFVSSISVYGEFPKPGLDEDDKVAQLADPTVEEVNGETYAGLKAACEQIVEQTYGSRYTIVRPGYVVGPGDSTDRFTYWPARVARGGKMLAPGSTLDPIQFIDVRDLATFMRRCAEERPTGRFNACTPPGAITMGQVLDASRRISGSNATFVWADADFIRSHRLVETGEIPIWLPQAGRFAGVMLVSSARAVQHGLRFRDLDSTLSDTLDWHNKRPAEHRQKLLVGLAPEREAELLKEIERAN